MVFLCLCVKAEVEAREQELDALQERVAQLKDRAKLQDTPVQLQVPDPPMSRHYRTAYSSHHAALGFSPHGAIPFSTGDE